MSRKAVRLIWTTEGGEELLTYIARVSNPKNQENQTEKSIEKLISFLIRQSHWSPFEMVNLCFEIHTTRDISAQILRHRSLSAQEFSQRYQDVTVLENYTFPVNLRYKGATNRQSSLEREDAGVSKFKHWISTQVKSASLFFSTQCYKFLLSQGVAKESARKILPMHTPTTLYMNGTLRSWIHYLNVRDDVHTQKEHRGIAKQIKAEIKKLYPYTAKALGWK